MGCISLGDHEISLKSLNFFSKLSVLSLNRDYDFVEMLLFLGTDLSVSVELLLQTFTSRYKLIILDSQFMNDLILSSDLLSRDVNSAID